MKRQLLLLLLLPVLSAGLIFVSCTKEGPEGPAGEDGINGTDGTATCGQCHNSGESFLAKVVQWEQSVHATGGNYARNTTSCAPCHTSMGFREVVETGETTTAEDISNPTPINCYTCHKVHETYTSDDWELRTVAPVAFLEGGATYDVGVSNLCAKCHQSRKADPYPAMGTGTIEFPEGTSYRWGPHHGPQSNLFAGVGVSGAYEVGSGYENSFHSNNFENGCKTCHMAPTPYGGPGAGGHTFAMGYEYHGSSELNFNGCLTSGCHTDEDALMSKVETKKLEIEDLMTQLKGLLEEFGIMDTVGHPGYLNVPGTYSNELAGAFYNYKFLEEDRSVGLHNFNYAKALLENSIAAIQ